MPVCIYNSDSLLVSISLGVIATAFILAFNSWLRAILAFVFEWTWNILASIFEWAWTKFITSTRLYVWWIEIKLNSRKFREKEKRITTMMKDDARAMKQEKEKVHNTKKSKDGKGESAGDTSANSV